MVQDFLDTAIAGPLLAQIGLTFLVLFYMYSQRIPSMKKLDRKPNDYRDNPALGADLAPKARYAAANLTNLFEMPVLFYMLCILAWLTGRAEGLFVILAWAYVGLRAVHSIIQCSYNEVVHRFAVFMVSVFVLVVMFGMVAGPYFLG